MNLEKLYKMQEELDQYIIKNRNITMSREELLDKTILALLVEVGELANATRCFKHWSTKGAESKERLLDELADIWHFYLSIGNQVGFEMDDIYEYASQKMLKKDENKTLTQCFVRLLVTGGQIGMDLEWYTVFGYRLECLAFRLGFTDEEVEQAYLKKHEENYRRQREGY